MTVLSLLILNKIACIELHTRAIGGNLHTDTGFPAVCSRNRTDIALCIIICYIVMVITACKLQLFKVRLNVSADRFGNIEIHRRSRHRCIFTGRNGLAVFYRSKILRMNTYFLVKHISAAFSVQIKIRMVGHIGNGSCIRASSVKNLQFVFLCEFIFHNNGKFSRKSVLSIRTDAEEIHAILLLGNFFYLPQLFLKAIRTAVKIVMILILCKNHFFIINKKSGILDTVSTSSNDRTEKASINLISPDIVISKDHILQISLLIRNTYLHQDRTILKHFSIGTFFILKMIDFYFFPCRKCPKFPFRNTHAVIPPIYEKRATNRLYVFNRLIPGCRSLIFDA